MTTDLHFNIPLPWQQSQWDFVLTNAKQNKLAHAILLTGAAGLGKALFAQHIVQTLLCERGLELNKPCGECRSCHLVAADTHPDSYHLAPEEEGKNIKIDTVRHLISRLQHTAQYNNYKVAIINPADQLNTAAANALLKTLEEPAARTLIILITSQPKFLPATIRSRCQILTFATPAKEISRDWLQTQIPAQTNIDLLLQLAENIPLRALLLAQDDEFVLVQQIIKNLIALTLGQTNPMQLAAEWNKLAVQLLLTEMRNMLLDLIRLKSNLAASYLRASNYQAELTNIARQVDIKKLYLCIDKINNAQLQFRATNLNQQLFLENLLYDWYEHTK